LRADDRGNVTPVALGLAGLVLVLFLALGDLGIFLLARAKAQTGADAAALAAAAELIPGSLGDPHAEASRFATANGARLVGYASDPKTRSVQVSVGVRVRFTILRGVPEVTARARAEVDLARFRG
jgi:secretion/DNA translocation related TadE-like protein